MVEPVGDPPDIVDRRHAENARDGRLVVSRATMSEMRVVVLIAKPLRLCRVGGSNLRNQATDRPSCLDNTVLRTDDGSLWGCLRARNACAPASGSCRATQPVSAVRNVWASGGRKREGCFERAAASGSWGLCTRVPTSGSHDGDFPIHTRCQMQYRDSPVCDQASIVFNFLPPRR